MNRCARLALPLALTAGLVVGCGSGDVSSNAPMGDTAGVSAESMPSDASVDVRREVIRTANVSMEVDDVGDAVVGISEAATDLDGSIQSRNITTYEDDATANVTIRIPAGNLDAFLTTLPLIGTVVNTTVDAQDVTLEVIDLEARIGSLEASIARLRDLQAQASSISDLVAVEAELASRQAELESLTARRDYLANQVDLSTVYIWMEQRDTGAALTPDFPGGLQRGWDALLTLGAGLITAVGFILPTALVGALVAAVIVIVIRLLRGRTKRKERT